MKTTDSIYSNNLKRDNINSKGEPYYDPPLPTSILEFKSERGIHRTQKPTTMMNWILKYYSKEGDVILDPTMGSGSMGVACKEMNREFIGIEMDEKYIRPTITDINIRF